MRSKFPPLQDANHTMGIQKRSGRKPTRRQPQSPVTPVDAPEPATGAGDDGEGDREAAYDAAMDALAEASLDAALDVAAANTTRRTADATIAARARRTVGEADENLSPGDDPTPGPGADPAGPGPSDGPSPADREAAYNAAMDAWIEANLDTTLDVTNTARHAAGFGDARLLEDVILAARARRAAESDEAELPVSGAADEMDENLPPGDDPTSSAGTDPAGPGTSDGPTHSPVLDLSAFGDDACLSSGRESDGGGEPAHPMPPPPGTPHPATGSGARPRSSHRRMCRTQRRI